MAIDTSGSSILLAAQVFGYAGNLYSSARQTQSIKQMSQLDQAAIGIKMQQETLQATQESIASTERLQEVLSSQRAIAGARGGAVSPAQVNKAVRAQGTEEANRALSKDYNIYQARAQQTLLKLNAYNDVNKVGAKQAETLFNNISLNELYNGIGRNKQETV